MRFLVISNKHELLGVFHRLKRTGHDVELIVWNSRNEDVWSGLATQVVRRSDGSLTPENLTPFIEAAKAGELTLITATPKAMEWFGGAQLVYGKLPNETIEPIDPLLLGGWFSGEAIAAPHLLVTDWGAWPGGLGPKVKGGLTLVRVDHLPSLVANAAGKAAERLKSASFRGLFHFSAIENPGTGEMELGGLTAGWPFLHTQAFLAELGDLGATLSGKPPELLKRFVTVLPVTVPPWPNPRQGGRRPAVEVRGLTPTQQGRCAWGDITVDPEHRKVLTAGLDGMVTVATGASDGSPALARMRALELATRLDLPEKQYRPDVGASVDAVLAALEDRWGLVL